MKNYQTNASQLVRLGVLTLDSYVTALAKTRTRRQTLRSTANGNASVYYIHQSGKFARRQDFLMLALFASDERWWFVHNGTDTKIKMGLLVVRILFFGEPHGVFINCGARKRGGAVRSLIWCRTVTLGRPCGGHRIFKADARCPQGARKATAGGPQGGPKANVRPDRR